MNEVQDILYDVADQKLFFDADVLPESITVEVFENADGDDATAEVATTGSAAAVTATTFDANSGYGQDDARIGNVTATTNIAMGRRLRLTNAYGEIEWAEVIAIESGVSFTARHPLKNAYVSGDDVEDCRMSISIDSTWVADDNNISSLNDPNPRYRCRWSYDAGGAGSGRVPAACVSASYFDLVRQSAYYTCTGLDVDDMFPGFLDSLPTHYREDQGASLVKTAYRAVKIDMHQDRKADQMTRNQEIVDILVIHKANELSQEVRLQRGGGSLEAVEAARSGYRERYNHLIREPKILFSTDSGGGGAEVTRTPIMRR